MRVLKRIMEAPTWRFSWRIPALVFEPSMITGILPGNGAPPSGLVS